MDLHGLAWTDMDVRADAEVRACPAVAEYIRPANPDNRWADAEVRTLQKDTTPVRWAVHEPPVPPRATVAGGGGQCDSRRTGGREWDPAPTVPIPAYGRT
jgi:hypothetical protein